LYIGEKKIPEICFMDEDTGKSYCLRSLLNNLLDGTDYMWLDESALLVGYNGHPSKAKKIK
jgi:hypothetical protein